jgi:hypothetical protein
MNNDVVLILISLAFFVVGWAYIAACDRL